MKGAELKKIAIEAKQHIEDRQGITSVDLIKLMKLNTDGVPRSGDYGLRAIKKKLGKWLFVQKDGILTRWYSLEYAIKNNISKHIDQDKNKNYGDPDAFHTAQSIQLSRMLDKYMGPGHV